MKRVNVSRLLQCLLLCLVAFSAIGCVSTDEPKKKKPVPPSDEASGLPWNRPRSFESGAGMGRMMPQSR
ncbi:MAG: hypothetical protein ACAH88_14555 [Roseimicrobium sp.]